MSDRSQIRCQTPGCAGALGSWVRGELIPAGHLVGGRDWHVAADGRTHLRCSYCRRWYTVEAVAGKLDLRPRDAA